MGIKTGLFCDSTPPIQRLSPAYAVGFCGGPGTPQELNGCKGLPSVNPPAHVKANVEPNIPRQSKEGACCPEFRTDGLNKWRLGFGEILCGLIEEPSADSLEEGQWSE